MMGEPVENHFILELGNTILICKRVGAVLVSHRQTTVLEPVAHEAKRGGLHPQQIDAGVHRGGQTHAGLHMAHPQGCRGIFTVSLAPSSRPMRL